MNLGKTIAINAARIPEKTAIIYGDKQYTYKEFNSIVNRLAHGFIEKGIKKGDKIALFMKNSDHFMIIFYAIMKAGAVAVPINFRLTAPEVNYILNDSDTILAFYDEELSTVIQEANKNTLREIDLFLASLNKVDGLNTIADLLTDNETNPDRRVDETDDCEILYTSGTTGRPKGALFDHHRIFHVGINLTAMMAIGQDDRFLHIAPLFHSAQLNLFMVLANYLGSTQVIMRDFHPVNTLDLIQKHRITIFFGVPTMYNFLIQVPNVKEYDLSTIKKCAYGSAPMPISLIKKSMELFGHQQFFNLCGLTEGGPGGICLTPERHLDKIGSGGVAIPNTEARVVDEEGNDVEVGKIGEFIIRGETIMKEYYKKPEETQKTIKNEWLHTGDLATIDEEGFITLVDRKKDMIISGGENVYSTEVENVIHAHPKVLEVAVIGIPDEVWGESVAAIVVPKEGEKIDFEEMKEFSRKSLAGYKVPRIFYEVDVLPRNASGKVLKYQLRKQYNEK